MDDIDENILRLLQLNARTPVSEISLKVGLSVPAVSGRIRKLESSGVIKQYTAILNPSMLKKELTALMFVDLDRPQFSDRLVKFVALEDEILECQYITGDFDYVLKIVTENSQSLERLLTRIKSNPGIKKTRTIVVLCTVKNQYSIAATGNTTLRKEETK